MISLYTDTCTYTHVHTYTRMHTHAHLHMHTPTCTGVDCRYVKPSPLHHLFPKSKLILLPSLTLITFKNLNIDLSRVPLSNIQSKLKFSNCSNNVLYRVCKRFCDPGSHKTHAFDCHISVASFNVVQFFSNFFPILYVIDFFLKCPMDCFVNMCVSLNSVTCFLMIKLVRPS